MATARADITSSLRNPTAAAGSSPVLHSHGSTNVLSETNGWVR